MEKVNLAWLQKLSGLLAQMINSSTLPDKLFCPGINLSFSIFMLLNCVVHSIINEFNTRAELLYVCSIKTCDKFDWLATLHPNCHLWEANTLKKYRIRTELLYDYFTFTVFIDNIWLGFMCKGYRTTFQLYWRRKTQVPLPTLLQAPE